MGSVDTPKAEGFYWLTIMFSQTSGTALGDWTADSPGFGYAGATLVFGRIFLVVTIAYYFTSISRAALFWTAFVITRPLGAVVGDYLDKPVSSGGLEFSRYTSTGILLVAIVLLVFVLPQRAAMKAH